MEDADPKYTQMKQFNINDDSQEVISDIIQTKAKDDDSSSSDEETEEHGGNEVEEIKLADIA